MNFLPKFFRLGFSILPVYQIQTVAKVEDLSIILGKLVRCVARLPVKISTSFQKILDRMYFLSKVLQCRLSIVMVQIVRLMPKLTKIRY